MTSATVQSREDAQSGADADLADEPLPRPVRISIGLFVVAAFVVILNETVMGVALPELMVDLDISAATAQWTTTGFLLTMAVVIPTTGQVLKRFSTRAVFMTAMSLFTIGAAIAASAPGFEILLAGRVVQACGAALVMPLLMTTVLTTVPTARRGRMMGLVVIVTTAAPAIGPTLSGAILSVSGWRWLFLLMVPIASTTLVIGRIVVENVTTPEEVRFDLVSVGLSAIAFGGLIYGLGSIGEAATGDAAVPPAASIAAGATALAGFVRRQIRLQRDDTALLDMRPFASRPFVLGITVLLIGMCALFGTYVLLPLYLQNVTGLSTMRTGLVLLPGGIVLAVASYLTGRAFDRYGLRPLAIPGTVTAFAGMVLMTRLDEASGVGLAIAAYAVVGAGLGLAMTPLMTSALGALDPAMYAHGSALVNTLPQLAGAAGTALFVTLLSRGTADGIAAGLDEVVAQAHGVHTAFTWGAALALIAAVTSLLLTNPEDETPA